MIDSHGEERVRSIRSASILAFLLVSSLSTACEDQVSPPEPELGASNTAIGIIARLTDANEARDVILNECIVPVDLMWLQEIVADFAMIDFSYRFIMGEVYEEAYRWIAFGEIQGANVGVFHEFESGAWSASYSETTRAMADTLTNQLDGQHGASARCVKSILTWHTSLVPSYITIADSLTRIMRNNEHPEEATMSADTREQLMNQHRLQTFDGIIDILNIQLRDLDFLPDE